MFFCNSNAQKRPNESPKNTAIIFNFTDCNDDVITIKVVDSIAPGRLDANITERAQVIEQVLDWLEYLAEVNEPAKEARCEENTHHSTPLYLQGGLLSHSAEAT